MEIKGWNYDYLNSKIEQYQVLLENALDDDMRAQCETQISTYQALLLDLLFQDGITYREEVTTADFLDAYHDVKNVYQYEQSLIPIFSNITRQFIDMCGFRKYDLEEKFKKDDSLEFVGEFIRANFGLESFQIYADSFLRDQSYVLFDRNNEIAKIAFTLDGERFIKVPSDGTINMVAAIAHEAGHNYGRSKSQGATYHDILGEFESYGYEICFLNWMMENNIYEQEAAKYMLNLMHSLENVMIARYYNNRYHLTCLKSPQRFESRLAELSFVERMQPKDMYEVFDTMGTAIKKNAPMYLYSFLCVLDCLSTDDYFTRYQQGTDEFGKTDSKVLAKKLLTRKITDLGVYRNWRESLMSKASKEN